MSEQQPESHQDPAEQYQDDTEVQTEGQPEPGSDDSSDQEADSPEAPVPAEPAPVTVQPADQSDVKTDTVFDKDYEVTPERGYRTKKTVVEQAPPPGDDTDQV